MIKVEKSVAIVEGTPKLICIELTHLLVHFIKTFEKDYDLTQDQAIGIVNECAKLAYMDSDDRAEFLAKLIKKD
jgi:hypothetical protein